MERANNLLCVNELLVAADSITEIESTILNHGPKLKFPLGTPDEAATIKSYQDDLRRLISTERISRRSDRSTAHIENGLVKIVRRVGKWKLFGTSNYMKCHEALYLMEMNRLDVYYDTVIVSLERAYSLFLRKTSDAVDGDKLSAEEYSVYSHFMRSGYNIQQHRPESNAGSSVKERKSNQSDSSSQTQQSIWNYLYELLGQPQNVSKRLNVNMEMNERVKVAMDSTIVQFRPQKVETNSLPSKRKHSVNVATTSDERRKTNEYFGTGRLNAFMAGERRDDFQKIFDKIDIIQLHDNEVSEVDPSETLNISFDLWTDGIYKKSENSMPNYRIVVLRDKRRVLPKIRQISHLFQRQVYKCPLILVYVSDEFSFHAYFYRFTTPS